MHPFSSQMKQHWNQRFGEKLHAYGTAPNQFFAEKLSQLEPEGYVLMPAEGQGRNAVFAARLGWQVDAFDLSEVGKDRALELAKAEGVELNYWLQDLAVLDLPKEKYDVIGLVFMHMPPEMRSEVHQKLVSSLKPGGVIILQGFSKKQLGLSSGGPKNLAMLFSEEELRKDFEGLDLEIIEGQASLDEGPYHQGKAELIGLVARKKKD
jgi:2-polyprenyl-3-methyl-5-hydroxy-6-metoxy-1,4-benzoquinol methylase